MQEVQAFLEGKEPDEIERERRMPKALRIAIQMVAGAAAAVVFMMVVYLIIAVVMHH